MRSRSPFRMTGSGATLAHMLAEPDLKTDEATGGGTSSSAATASQRSPRCGGLTPLPLCRSFRGGAHMTVTTSYHDLRKRYGGPRAQTGTLEDGPTVEESGPTSPGCSPRLCRGSASSIVDEVEPPTDAIGRRRTPRSGDGRGARPASCGSNARESETVNRPDMFQQSIAAQPLMD